MITNFTGDVIEGEGVGGLMMFSKKGGNPNNPKLITYDNDDHLNDEYVVIHDIVPLLFAVLDHAILKCCCFIARTFYGLK